MPILKLDHDDESLLMIRKTEEMKKLTRNRGHRKSPEIIKRA
jgi:hypothetical protein